MTDEPKNRIVVTVHLDVAVDGGYGETKALEFPAVDDVVMGQERSINTGERGREGILSLHCGPSTNHITLSRIVWWEERPQTEAEAALPPPWEQIGQPGVIPIALGRSPLPAETNAYPAGNRATTTGEPQPLGKGFPSAPADAAP